MRRMIHLASLLLSLAPWAGPAHAQGGHTVVIEPGDVTPLRGPNVRNPLGPGSVYAPLPPLPAPGAELLERDLERDLDRLPSRAAARPERALPRLELDRERTRAALEAFKTLRPNAPQTPLFERQLDRVERPSDLGQ